MEALIGLLAGIVVLALISGAFLWYNGRTLNKYDER